MTTLRVAQPPDEHEDLRVLDARVIEGRAEHVLRYVTQGHTHQRCREELVALLNRTYRDGVLHGRSEYVDRAQFCAELDARR